MDQRSVDVKPLAIDSDNLGFFRWGRVAGAVLVTNDAGDWTFLTEEEFAELLAGSIGEGHGRFQEFRDNGLIRDGLDLDAFASKVAERNRHVRRGPHVHVVELTRRGGANGTGESVLDMSVETAEKVVDFALAGMSPSMTFEFSGSGGEPLLNFEVLRHFVETAQSRNTQTTGKTLSYDVLTNLSAMTEEIAEWLIANDVRLITTLDGPAALHDANREKLGGSVHADVIRWIEYFNRRYVELDRDPAEWHVEARLAVTRKTLESGREVVDEYIARGMRTIHLNPLAQRRVSAETWAEIGYSEEQYLDFYRETLAYVLDQNRKGFELAEGMAAVIATKILRKEDPGIVDIQSPYGAGTGQIAYEVDGTILPCDEARGIASGGESTFALGTVQETSIAEIVRHPTVRAMAAASLLDSQPMCAECWNKPYCGFSPVRNFLAQGDLFGQRPNCFECREHITISKKIFEKLSPGEDAAAAEFIERWASAQPGLVDARAVKRAP